ncbi:unnamed protein product [Caenorhabditis bovis]|uniref:Uncharacterized protein n=1 Tax=Caenorhabditis bovis TaxID=2654633 RepID=A0A8S1EVX8_9PELO|nr:unnamed protein product [Caenorhabditis bovis]
MVYSKCSIWCNSKFYSICSIRIAYLGLQQQHPQPQPQQPHPPPCRFTRDSPSVSIAVSPEADGTTASSVLNTGSTAPCTCPQ